MLSIFRILFRFCFGVSNAAIRSVNIKRFFILIFNQNATICFITFNYIFIFDAMITMMMIMLIFVALEK